MISKLFFIVFSTLFSLILSSENFVENIRMGPILHFSGQDREKETWKVSALYVLAAGTKDSAQGELVSKKIRTPIVGEVLGTKFGYEFVKYDLTVTQKGKERKVKYKLAGEEGFHVFFVPAIGQNNHILYHSCNGYQSEEDRKRMRDIEPMWQEINRRHEEQPFHLQLGGGDQLYADGLIDTECGEQWQEPSIGKIHGVFALVLQS